MRPLSTSSRGELRALALRASGCVDTIRRHGGPWNHRRNRATSTIQYYRAVVEMYRARSGGRAPRVLINSLDGDEVFSLLCSADAEGLAAVLLDGIQQLCNAGADLALFAS